MFMLHQMSCRELLSAVQSCKASCLQGLAEQGLLPLGDAYSPEMHCSYFSGSHSCLHAALHC